MLKGKKIVLGITGGIAAYKSVELARAFLHQGADVFVAMTPAAKRFIAPLTFAALTGHSVYDDVYAPGIEHVRLAQEADLVVVAPATANTLAKMAWGMADNAVTALALATTAPILVAPAMNTGMYMNAATRVNLGMLLERGVWVVGPGQGPLACGHKGRGRLADIAEILRKAGSIPDRDLDLNGMTLVVTAGPTREPWDAVRILTNRSSGKMGHAIASACHRHGARTVLITGAASATVPPGIKVVRVETALEMRKAVLNVWPSTHALIMAAAVSDYRPERRETEKLKKSGQPISLKLIPNPDILTELGQKKGRRILVGFAANEARHLIDNARRKLKEKNLDMIVANPIDRRDAGFQSETNRAVIITSKGSCVRTPLLSKAELSERILERLIKILPRKRMA